MSETLSREVGLLAGRLADLIGSSIPPTDGPVAQSHAFLRSMSAESPKAGVDADADERYLGLAARLELSPLEKNLLVLAGMPEEHEGFAAIFRALHPHSESRPSAGLAAQLFSEEAGSRRNLRTVLESGRLVSLGLLQLTGDTPFFDRSLQLADGIWSALLGGAAWPEALDPVIDAAPLYGLEEWLASAEVTRATKALVERGRYTVLVSADSAELALQRSLALVAASGRNAVGFSLPNAADARLCRLIQAHAVTRDFVPVLSLPVPDAPPLPETPDFPNLPDGVVLSGRTGGVTLRTRRPLISIRVEPIGPLARRRMWSSALPELNGAGAGRAARYSVEPATAAIVASDLRIKARLDGRAPELADLSDSLQARTSAALTSGVKIVRPQADWNDLVLSRERLQLLKDAIARLDAQATVLDEWGFLKGRTGSRGVRMLFSGPPGTGKTFSAEVMARALGVDLLVVDISRVVSKWIGETEKNLAAVFDSAERAQAVLFFDEADALFGKRTEVADAHDRYANLETAYLLTRLERFEGLAILATNLRRNIDQAFLRRLEFVIDFDEPDREERHQIWSRHMPCPERLDERVNLYELAAHYPVVGGFIRNAAVAAAFLAAADGDSITCSHLVRAIRREYGKAGRAFPGVPAGVRG